MARVLVVDDDPVQLRQTAELAARAGYQPVTATSGRQALDALRADRGIAAMVLDLVMPDLDGMAVLDAMRRDAISIPVIVQSASGALDGAMGAMKHGAVDFCVKPVTPERLAISLRNALRLGELEQHLRGAGQRQEGTLDASAFLTRAPAMDRVLALAAKSARINLPVLIEGEAGTGKDLLARIIHGGSDRAGKAFVAIDCSTLPAGQEEAMLFGSRRNGVDKPGRIAEAQGGTLFLQEIGELSEALQERLLRLVESGEYQPVGADRALRLNLRLVATTSRRLLNLTKAGLFREDLYYRLNVMPIYVPPLRDRGEDVELLARHFLTRFAAETGRRVNGLAEATLALLRRHQWSGNVGELESLVYRAVVLAEGNELTPHDFPQLVAADSGRPAVLALVGAAPRPSVPVHIDDPNLPVRETASRQAAPDRFMAAGGEVSALADVERDLIAFALSHYGFRMSRVARALGIGRSTLYRKLREYGLDEGLESDAA